MRIIGCLAGCAVASMALAQTTSIQLPGDNPLSRLRAGAGEDVVRRHCAVCHSTDYIVRQPHLDAQRWDAEVKKMMTVYGASISEADAKIIADYLAKNYGQEIDAQKPPSSK